MPVSRLRQAFPNSAQRDDARSEASRFSFVLDLELSKIAEQDIVCNDSTLERAVGEVEPPLQRVNLFREVLALKCSAGCSHLSLRPLREALNSALDRGDGVVSE